MMRSLDQCKLIFYGNSSNRKHEGVFELKQKFSDTLLHKIVIIITQQLSWWDNIRLISFNLFSFYATPYFAHSSLLLSLLVCLEINRRISKVDKTDHVVITIFSSKQWHWPRIQLGLDFKTSYQNKLNYVINYYPKLKTIEEYCSKLSVRHLIVLYKVLWVVYILFA